MASEMTWLVKLNKFPVYMASDSSRTVVPKALAYLSIASLKLARKRASEEVKRCIEA